MCGGFNTNWYVIFKYKSKTNVNDELVEKDNFFCYQYVGYLWLYVHYAIVGESLRVKEDLINISFGGMNSFVNIASLISDKVILNKVMFQRFVMTK